MQLHKLQFSHLGREKVLAHVLASAIVPMTRTRED